MTTEQDALARMVMPSQHRAGKPMGGVIQIRVARACNEACPNCTQGSNFRGATEFMSVEHFETSCMSLVDYFGIVGMFGGCPTLHPQFPQLCSIMRKHLPKDRCGLWANNPFGHAAACSRTFNPAVSNLNVHGDMGAYDEFKRGWPGSNPFGVGMRSRHAPVFVSMEDVVPDESERWSLIANCDINKHWSAAIGSVRGSLRGYFCEIAMSLATMHPEYPDLGVEVRKGWWRARMDDQVRLFCHRCGVPLRGRGSLDDGDTTHVSREHSALQPKKGRIELVATREELGTPLQDVTKYVQNAR
jgi:hypothetical protein